ncbi:MAG: pyridoxamine 5'-phosphate oxidase family protein [Alphaproteobacteria bacterium]|nr:pyridoxamine 5'-phosphate oxidase family protein [Alphaproteobacteria bacterium]
MSRGAVRHKDKEMPADEIARLLDSARLGHFATVDADGEPYVIPNLFVHAEGRLYLHTSAGGHFNRNVAHAPRICFEIAEMGTIYPYGEFECDTTVSYASVVGFGTVHIEEDAAAKARFFDRFMAKYGDPKWVRPKGFYPRLDQVTVYCIVPERVTGKMGALPAVADQWPARNLTKSPGAKPPKG